MSVMEQVRPSRQMFRTRQDGAGKGDSLAGGFGRVAASRRSRPEQRLKVLLVNKFFHLNGGSERVLFQELEYFRSIGLDVVEFSMRDSRNVESAFADHFIPGKDYRNRGGLFGELVKAASFVHSPGAVSRLRRLVERERPSVAHLHNIYHQITPSIIPMLKKQGMKIVLSLHDYKLICPNYLMLNKGEPCDFCAGSRFYGPLAKNCQSSRAREALLSAEAYVHKWFGSYRHVDAFIAPSQFMADMMVRFRLPAERVHVIRNGIEEDPYRPTWEDRGYGIYLGRISGEKGVETLLRAHGRMQNPMGLKIIGTGPMLEQLKRRYPHADFLGYRSGEELMDLVRGAGFMVMPSEWYENCPMSALECMALGKPMIGSRVGGIPELIEDNRTGLLFNMGDVDDLAEKMDLLGNDSELRARMGRAAKAKQERDHNLLRRNQKVIEIYQRLLENK